MSDYYATRKEQIEQEFLWALCRHLKAEGVILTRVARALIKEELRAAAMVGAAEERYRTLKLIEADPTGSRSVLSEQIVEHSVLKVLGYETSVPRCLEYSNTTTGDMVRA